MVLKGRLMMDIRLLAIAAALPLAAAAVVAWAEQHLKADRLVCMISPDNGPSLALAGRLLLDGGYRRTVDASELEAALAVARARFLELMAATR